MISLENYGGGYSAGSQIKAMKVEIGNFTLYFSYSTLIGFEIVKSRYPFEAQLFLIREHSYALTSSYMTNSHKSQIKKYDREVHYVDKDLLKELVMTNMLKQQYKER